MCWVRYPNHDPVLALVATISWRAGASLVETAGTSVDLGLSSCSGVPESKASHWILKSLMIFKLKVKILYSICLQFMENVDSPFIPSTSQQRQIMARKSAKIKWFLWEKYWAWFGFDFFTCYGLLENMRDFLETSKILWGISPQSDYCSILGCVRWDIW